MLSAAVEIMPPPTQAAITAAALGGSELRAYMPTQSEVRDAMLRVIRELEDMRVARGYSDWATGGFDINLQNNSDGSCSLRGNLVIERAD